MSLPTDWTHAFVVDGVPAVAAISPCSWMYPHTGLQVEVTINGGRVYFKSETRFADASEAVAVALAAQAKHRPCVTCGEPAVVNPSSNRAGQCEKCFMAALHDKYAPAMEKAAQAEAKQDAQAKAKGFKFKTVARVHPKSGGSDYEILWYTAEAPAATDVAAVLRRKRSAVLTDYTTTPL